jgi:hypothetical protein
MAQITPIEPQSLSEAWNPMQGAMGFLQLQQIAEQTRHHQVMEGRQQAQLNQEEQRKQQEFQTMNKLKGIEFLLKNRLLPMTKQVDLYNEAAQLMSLPDKFGPEDLGGDALLFKAYLEAFTKTGTTDSPESQEAFDALLKNNPDLGDRAKRIIGIKQWGERAIPGGITMEMAQATETNPAASHELVKSATSGELTEAKIDLMKSHTLVETKRLDTMASEAALNTDRSAFYRARQLEVLANQKLLQQRQELGGLQLQQAKRKGEMEKALDEQTPLLQEQVKTDLTKFHTDIVTMEKALTTTRDPHKRQQLEDDIAYKNLLVRSRESEGRYLQSKTPEMYRLWQQSEEAVNQSLERKSVMLEQTANRTTQAQERLELSRTKEFQSLYSKALDLSAERAGIKGKTGGMSFSFDPQGGFKMGGGAQQLTPEERQRWATEILTEIENEETLPASVKRQLQKNAKALTAGLKPPAPATGPAKAAPEPPADSTEAILKRLEQKYGGGTK